MLNFKSFMVNHRPEIMMGLGIVGSVAATGLGIYITNKQKEKYDRWVDSLDYYPSKTDTIKFVLPAYLPVIALQASSIASIIFATKIYIADFAALSQAATGLCTTAKYWQKAVNETLTDEQREEVKKRFDEQVVADYKTNSPLEKDGKRLFIETMTGHEFYSTKEEMLNVKDDLSERALSGEELSYNEFYELVRIPYNKAADYIFFPADEKVQMIITGSTDVDNEWNSPLLVTFPGLYVSTGLDTPLYKTY